MNANRELLLWLSDPGVNILYCFDDYFFRMAYILLHSEDQVHKCLRQEPASSWRCSQESHQQTDDQNSQKDDKETDLDFDHCSVFKENYKQNDVWILPAQDFHKSCVYPWLSKHYTTPICRLNILKALEILPNFPCTDNVAFDMERLTRTQAVN